MPNQNKPNPPKESIRPHAHRYWLMGMTVPKILEALRDHFDQEQYGLGKTKLREWLNEWGFVGVYKQGHTVESLHQPIQDLRIRFPTVGSQELRNLLLTEKGIKASKDLILEYLRLTEPEAVASRKGRAKFVRKRFYAAGVNHIWAVDQHDKWRRFGLFFHLCTEPYAGKLLWLIVWWTNSNPRLVTRQYIQTALKFGGIPLITQSDLGSENFGIANAHTSIRQLLDPSLRGTLQHKWMGKHNNIKPEIAWKQFRQRFAPGFEELFDEGLNNDWYDPANILQKLIFRALAIPFIQRELDAYVYRHNTSARRANKHKILPHGIADIIFEKPEKFGAQDLKIDVPEDVLLAAERVWAPPTHPVFQLVPPAFGEFLRAIDYDIGSPAVDFKSFWDVYLAMLTHAQQRLPQWPSVQRVLDSYAEAPEAGEDYDIPLLDHTRAAEFGQNGIPAMNVVQEYVPFIPSADSRPDDGDEVGLIPDFVEEEFVEVPLEQDGAVDATAVPEAIVYLSSDDEGEN